MDSKQSKMYKYSAVHGDEPSDLHVEHLRQPATNERSKKTVLTAAMGSTLIAAVLFFAIGYVTFSRGFAMCLGQWNCY